ncbi:MAG: TetR/AcrR family transcriptional regulator [Gemmatimonadales bacterium]
MTESVGRDGARDVECVILDEARDLLAEGGLECLSMRAVADRVGVSATALYHYFESKQDLIERVVSSGYKRFGEYLERAIAEHPRGSLDRITALGEAYVLFASENKAYFRVLFNLQAPSPRDIDELPCGGGYHLLQQCVREAMSSGEIASGDADLVSMYLWTCVHGLVTLALACHFQHAGECNDCSVPESPAELFQTFRPMIAAALGRGEPRQVGIVEELRDTA